MKDENQQVFDLYKRKNKNKDEDVLIDQEYENVDKREDPADQSKGRKSKRDRKNEDKAKHREIMKDNRMKNTLSSCRLCMVNSFLTENQILSYGTNAFLALPQHSTLAVICALI